MVNERLEDSEMTTIPVAQAAYTDLAGQGAIGIAVRTAQ